LSPSHGSRKCWSGLRRGSQWSRWRIPTRSLAAESHAPSREASGRATLGYCDGPPHRALGGESSGTSECLRHGVPGERLPRCGEIQPRPVPARGLQRQAQLPGLRSWCRVSSRISCILTLGLRPRIWSSRRASALRRSSRLCHCELTPKLTSLRICTRIRVLLELHSTRLSIYQVSP
jgi:hypothetical protein